MQARYKISFCNTRRQSATGECASFPGTRKELEKYARQKNATPQTTKEQQPCH